jgi:hypothetical protein
VALGSSPDPQVLVEPGDSLAEAGLYDDAIAAYERVQSLLRSSKGRAWLLENFA